VGTRQSSVLANAAVQDGEPGYARHMDGQECPSPHDLNPTPSIAATSFLAKASKP